MTQKYVRFVIRLRHNGIRRLWFVSVLYNKKPSGRYILDINRHFSIGSKYNQHRFKSLCSHGKDIVCNKVGEDGLSYLSFLTYPTHYPIPARRARTRVTIDRISTSPSIHTWSALTLVRVWK